MGKKMMERACDMGKAGSMFYPMELEWITS